MADDAGLQRPTLRFLTCGSVDDGKSTLIGRLLYEQNSIFDDQLSALERDSKKHGTVGDDIDFALLVDGLEAEREQGITIDVAYRYFATPRRAFIVADTPGPRAVHPQHGDRRLQRRSRDPAGRRPQGPAAPDAAARLYRVAARHPERRAGGQQDRSRRLRPACLQQHRARLRSLRGPAQLQVRDRRSRCRPAMATTCRSARSACPGTTGRRWWASSKPSMSTSDRADQAVPPAGPMGQPAEPRLPRLLRHGRGRHASGPATRSSWRARGGPAWSTASSAPAAILPRASAGDAVTLTLARRDRHRARRRSGRSEAPAAGRRPVRGPCHLDERGAPAAGPLLPDEDRHAARPRDGDRPQAPGRHQHPRPHRGQDAGAERDRLLQPRRLDRRSPSTPTARTATPAPSS